MYRAHTHKDEQEDPYHSKAEVAERLAFEKRNFRIKVGLVLAIPVVVALLYFAIDYVTNVGY